MTAELIVGLVGGILGGAVTSYFGPLGVLKWQERRQEERKDGPRKRLLEQMLRDEKTEVRSLARLSHVTGTTDEECRRLLIEIEARGVVMADGSEGWALIERYPLDR